MRGGRLIRVTLALTMASLAPGAVQAQRTAKPVLHGRHWVAITGKPLAATAGAMTFGRGGNAVDAAEAANITSHQVRGSFGQHESRPGHMTLTRSTPPWVQQELQAMGYDLDIVNVNSGPINAIFFDRAHGTMWGGSAIQGDDYGIAW